MGVHKKPANAVTVVSEGLLFVGVRTPRAWTWVEVGPAESAPDVPAAKPASPRVRQTPKKQGGAGG